MMTGNVTITALSNYILRWILWYQTYHGYGPTIRAIMAGTGIMGYHTVHEAVARLREDGYLLTKPRHTARQDAATMGEAWVNGERCLVTAQ